MVTSAARDGYGQGVAPDRIEVEVRTRSDRGQVFCAIFSAANAAAYPTRREQATVALRVAIRGQRALCTFDVPPGEYAVAVYHDENDNGRLDRGVFGIPVEGTGASNDARGSFGPPSFASARFVYRGQGVGTVRVRVNY